MHDDKSRLAKVLELLPEWFIREFLGYYLFNIYYPYGYIERLERFDTDKDEIMLEFSNRKINAKFEILKRKFESLNEFLVNHFSVPRAHYKAYENPPYLYLEPRLHHNFFHSELGGQQDYTDEMRSEFNRLAAELNVQREEFWEAYRDFLRTAKADSSVWSRWWDTSWFNLSMGALAILGVLGIGGWTYYRSSVQNNIQGDVVGGDQYNQNIDTLNFFSPTSTNSTE